MSARPIVTPCVNICRMEPASGLCVGCLRTLDEIVAWAGLDDAGRQAVMRQLPERRRRRRVAAAEPLPPLPMP